MKAGRKLDAKVAEEVMGWMPGRNNSFVSTATGNGYFVDKFWKDEDKIGESKQDKTIGAVLHTASLFRLWQPSTDIAAAWQVVEKFLTLGYNVNIYHEENIACAIAKLEPEFYFMQGKTAPHAICLAALEAVK